MYSIYIYIYINIDMYIYIYPRGRGFPEGGKGWGGVGCDNVHVSCVNGWGGVGWGVITFM